ncbi:MAG: glycosyltransferase family 4 protein [Candidatus Omnitrophica bacterium]|nr:glycosyltransferase family 4 protein [Candidatus Omnitrophota bacterium]
MARINLLFIVTKLELGGAQKQLLSLIQGLGETCEFNIFLFTAKEGLLLEDVLKIDNITLRKSSCLVRAINPFKDLLALFEIYRFIKKNNIKIVHTHSSKAGILGRFAAKLAGAKCVIHTVHGWPFHEYQPWLYRSLYIYLEKQIAKFSDKIVVVSQADREMGLRHSVGRNDQYQLIRYGIEPAFFGKPTAGRRFRAELSISADHLLVTNISCFKPQKSPLDFIRVANLVLKTLPEVKFLLIGDGKLRQGIEKLIRELHLEEKIILAGWRRDIPEILCETNVLVLTSLWEGLPISVLEALASGCPVVATDTGGIREVVADGKNGFLVQPKEIFKMAEKLTLLLQNGALRQSMSTFSRKSLQDGFYFRDSCRHYQQLYKNFIVSKGMDTVADEYVHN